MLSTMNGCQDLRLGDVQDSILSNGLCGQIFKYAPIRADQWSHSRQEAEFSLVISGSGTCVLDGVGEIKLTPQTAIWVAPGQPRRLLPGPNLEMWSLIFRPDLLGDTWIDELRAEPVRVISTQEMVGLDHLLSEISQDADDPQTFNPAVQYAIRRALRASHDRPAAALKSMHPAVVRALEIM